MDNKKPRRNSTVFVEDSNQQHKSKKEIISTLIKKKTKDKFLSDSQKEYYEILQNNQITICSGPAGVGKSYIAMKAAVDLLADPNNSYEKLIIVRPAVEAEEKLGSLPGNVEEKLDPYIFPSYYLLNKIIGKEAREKLKEIEAIEVFALAYMRGRTFKNCWIVADEMQNSTVSQMKMLMTRLGENSRLVITGDLEQYDRINEINGLEDFLDKFKGKRSSSITSVEFKKSDIQREEVVKEVLDIYGGDIPICYTLEEQYDISNSNDDI